MDEDNKDINNDKKDEIDTNIENKKRVNYWGNRYYIAKKIIISMKIMIPKTKIKVMIII